jgi:hypothetical protein
VASTDVNGHFQGIIYTISGAFKNFQASGTDVAISDTVTSNILRPAVR